ncbi:hypothetical protein M0Q97_08750 [Candidatus Dojkabacteria bacterium]|jgi:hypothetical protein|nr:hypothetical protein [Candidatus Dojkabacteria bacterium]
MIDLTNNNTEDINVLVQKYTSVLQVSNLNTIDEIRLLAKIIDEAIKYIANNHSELTIDLKIWSILVLKNIINKIKTDDDVKKYIDEFVEYWGKKYEKYCNYLGMSASDFDRDYYFVLTFIKIKKSHEV